MKKIGYLLFSIMVLFIGLVGCTTSESAIQTAIAKTEVVVQVATQDALNIKKTQEAILAATETAKTLSVSQTQAALPQNCNPGGTYVDIEGDVDIDYMDILKVDTVLKKDLLTVTFYIRGLPKEITINREGIQSGSQEYTWGVDIDVDNNIETGGSGERLGFDYGLQLFTGAQGRQHTGPIEKLISAYLWKYGNKPMNTAVGKAKLSVNYEKNTITLSSKVPGINKNSILSFFTFYSIPNDGVLFDYLCN